VCNAESIGGPCRDAPDTFDLLVTAPAVAAVVLGPGLILLLVAARRARAMT